MAGPEDQRRGPEDEDLFEDLDQFFAPLDETEEPEAGIPERPTVPEPPSREAEGSVEEWDLEIDVPEEEELLAEPPAGDQPPPVTPEGPGEAAEEQPEAAEPLPPEEPVSEARAPEIPPETGMGAAPDDREDLERDEMRAEALAAEEGPGEEAAAEPSGERLTAGDLRTSPPEYEELPSADGGEEEEEIQEPVLSTEDLFEEAPAGPTDVDAVGEEEPGPTEEKPEAEAIEAAADHFATGLRGSPGEIERELLADLESAPDQTVTIESGPPPATPPPPTWQEGAETTEEPAEEAPARPSPGRNLVAAALSGIVLAVAVIVLLVIDKGPFAVFAAIVILLGQAELYAVMRTRRLQPATLLGLVCGALMLAGAYLHGPAAVLFGLVLATALTVLWYMAAPGGARRNVAVNVGATLLGAAYVPFLASFALLLLAFPGDLGRNIFLIVLGLTVLYDVVAYAVGTLWGNRPLAPTISPNKSWEGVIGATLGVLIVALSIVPAFEPFTGSRAVGLALVIALTAPLGDLVESALKRDLGVKDMGTILPGHGGILDRIDAILFTAPAAYYFLQLSF
jgi:phosphatidate cytidylyltransferase